MLSPNTILQERYRVVRELGQGGMGYVYEAIDQRVNCIVAIKETMTSDNAESRRAFEREAALLANLRHRGLPKVMDYFSENDGDFLVMEFIPGRDLAELLDVRGRTFSQSEVLHWADQLLAILVYLHSRVPPILHRDIKPSNLKLSEDGELFLLDFGLAKGALGQMPTLATSRSVRGYTPVYAPLEQILGQGTDPRSDLYSVGATLYHLLTGVAPVDAPTRFHAVEDDRPDPLEPVHDLNPQVSSDVSAVVSAAMSLSRKQRPSTANEMRQGLKELIDKFEGQELEKQQDEEERKKRDRGESQRSLEAETRKRESNAAAPFPVQTAPANIEPATEPTLPAPPPAPISFKREIADSRTQPHVGINSSRWRRRLWFGLAMISSAFLVWVLVWVVNMIIRAPSSPNENATQAVTPNPGPAPTTQPSPTQGPSPTPMVAKTINPPRDFLDFAKGEEGYTGDVKMREVDLNRDGVPELIAQYQLCGSGGCISHVLRRNGGSFQDISGGLGEYLMPPLDRSSIQAGPTMMNGYLDIKYDRQYFTFDGRRYQCARGC